MKRTDRTGIAVIGAGGHAKVIIAALRAAGTKVAGAFGLESNDRGSSILGVPVLGDEADLAASGLRRGVIAVGDNRKRLEIAERLDLDWVSVVHPAAWVDPSVTLRDGAVVLAGVVIQPDAQIGEHAILNTGAGVDHDCRIGRGAHVAPGVYLAGNVTLGEGVLLGVGCSVVPGVSIGDWAVVAAAAAVVRDIPPAVTARGVPARWR